MADHDQRTLQVDGHELHLSHLDRVISPTAGFTKADVVGYYQDIAPVMLPYLLDHPLTMVSYPDGIDGRGIYLRDQPRGAPDWLRCVPYQPETRAGERCVPLVDGVSGMLWYVDRGNLEFHLWPSTGGSLARPDWAIFDLDPGPDVDFARVLEVALLVRDALLGRGIVGLPKTTGGRGVHVFVPIEPADPYSVVRDWVKDVAERLDVQHPDLIGTAGGRTHRAGLVTIDHAQNSLGRNTAAPYTLRATAEALVSAPLSWDDVERGAARPGDFTLRTLGPRVRDVGDPWAAALRAPRRRLPPVSGAGN